MKMLFRKLFLFLDILALSGAALMHSGFPAPAHGAIIASESALCMDAKTGEVLYGKAAHKTMYPASTTKVMTALLLIEYANEHGWDERVYVSENAVRSIGPRASNIGLLPGDVLALDECLYAIMLASANEVCIAVAEHIAGSVETFAEMMNERAWEIGALSTYFTNPTGLPDRNHVTTAYDIALIMIEAIKEEAFTAVIAAPGHTVFPRGPEEPNHIKNRNMLIQDGTYRREYVVGGKTGYTSAAWHTLVNYAVMDGAELICVVLRAPNFMTYPDTIALFEFGFSALHN